ncbi:SRPBCC family protein [Noviherbaspirillum autotrophicum]|uniref:SRPBCC family protein n=1 Tax=Noviherbaspirillum autotrophicum TaxID=709839 RepID=UPI000AD38588|nr:SRPBCC family protein [Noviherbaspirillum autotrophicum]
MMQGQAADTGTPVGARPPATQVTEYPPYENRQFSSPAFHQEQHADGALRARQVAQALGWFSIGLGVAQLLAPRMMARTVGAPSGSGMLLAVGARELASGIGLLSQSRRQPWLWARVAGDAMDLALLGMAARSAASQRRRLALTAAAVAGVAALDILAGMKYRQQATGHGVQRTMLHVEKSITINRSAEECYRFWHDFENFPSFMKHLDTVQITGENRIHWKAKGPAGTHVEWDAELIADEPGQYIAWHSLQGADVDHSGSVHFEHAPGGRGTIVRVVLQYNPPGGTAGAWIARLFGEAPEQQIDEDLRRFKWLIETGEVPTTVGQPSGPRGMVNRLLFRKGEPG